MSVLETTTDPQAHGSPSVGIFSRALDSRSTPTGVGMVSPLGSDASSTWQALLDGQRVVDHARARLDRADGPSRAAQVALAAANEALKDARHADLSQAALVVGTSKGPVEQWIHGSLLPSGIGEIAEVVAQRLGIAGPRLTVSAACASGLHALIRGALMIQSRDATRVLVVAAESSLHPLFIASFQRLGVLPPRDVGCKPFDRARAGFVMSEASAAVMLEAIEADRAVPLARITGTPLIIDRIALAGDPSHLTHGDPDGRVLRSVLHRVADGADIDLVHAHGTGTLANDPIELSAIDDIAGNARPLVYSHKGALGHSLGASGLLAVVINSLCHQNSVVPPNAATEHPLPTRNVQLSRKIVRREIRASIALAAGFGGAIAAVRLRSFSNLPRF